MSDDEQHVRDRPSGAPTIRTTRERVEREANELSNDRPTPRSTVIPRLPSPPPMRPRFETLIFHGAPPLPPPPFPPPSPLPPPPREDTPEDLLSAELLEDHEGAAESERPTPDREPESARTDRPPPLSVSLRPSATGSRARRIAAAVAAAIAVPVLATLLIARPVLRRSAALRARAEAVPASKAPQPPAPALAPGSCAVNGGARLLARRALVRGGVEAAAVDERIAFAALTSTKSGTAFELDARTLAVTGSAKVVAGDPVRRVVPELGDDAPVEAQADTGAFRTLADADGDSAIGVRDGFIVWGPRDGDGMVRLWRLAWPQSIDAPRVSQLGASGERVIALRRAGGIWVGSFRGGQTTSDLIRLSTGDFVGVPALDTRGDEAIVAWAQRDSASSAWGVRWTRWTSHARASVAHELAIPPGGPGDRAMAPSVSTLDDGRFLLAWTEAGHGKNQVRAQVFDAADHPLGDVLAVSQDDAIAGQEQIALTDGGRGAIAYLVARRGAFELRATAIDCSVRGGNGAPTASLAAPLPASPR